MTAQHPTPPKARPAVKERTPPKKRTAVTILRRIGLVVLGVVLYAVCINMFAGFPQVHSGVLSWIAIGGLSVFAAIVWIVDERRSSDAEDAGEDAAVRNDADE